MLAGGIAGWGVYNGMRTKAYAKDAQTMMDGVKEWEKSLEDLDFEKDLAEIKTKIAKVKTDSENNLAKLNASSAPGKAKNLEKDLKEYFTTSKSLAEEAGELVDWAAEVQKVVKSMESLSGTSTASTEAMIADLEKQQKELEEAQKKLEKMTPPDSVKKYHDVLVELLDEVVDVYDKMIPALKNNDMSALMSITADTSSITEKSKEIEESDKDLESTFKDDSEKLDKLETTIYTEIGSLKNINFAF